MKFLSSLFDSKPQEIHDPDQLREALFAAVSRQDWNAFAQSCLAKKDVIAANFPSWQKVPQAAHDDATTRTGCRRMAKV